MIGDFRLGDPETDEQQPATTARADVQVSGPTGRIAGSETGAQRDHAARVEAHESVTGWSPEQAVRLASLTARLAKLERQSPVSTFASVIACVVGAADLVLAGFAILWALRGYGDRAEAGVLILLAMFVPTVWAAWTITRLVQRRHRHTYRAERDRLRQDRGCGDPTCPQCA